MRECLRLAARGKGSVSPNPLVGAVLVRKGRVIGKGYHRRFGGPHAEVNCVRSIAGSPKGSTLYVNLEPCSYYGKTPPCVDLLIGSGIREVFAAMKDPNPLVAGRSIRMLRAAGIAVHVGLLGEEARLLNRAFVRSITMRRPYVHLKIAQSLDGMIAGPGGERRWITSPASRVLIHRMRAEHDAVLVGAGTVRLDNPRLSVRRVRGRDPHVVILDGRLSVSPKARVFSSTRKRLVVVCTTARASHGKAKTVRALVRKGVKVLKFDEPSPRLRLRPVLRRLHQLNIGSLLIEGGRNVFSQFVNEGLVDELSLFVAPMIMGKGLAAVDGRARRRLARLLDQRSASVTRVGSDILLNNVVREE